MKSKLIKPFLFILAELAMVSASAQESITLRFRPQPGLVCSIDSKELTLVQSNGFEVSVNNEIVTDVSVKDVAGTQAEIEAQIESLKSNTSAILGIGVKYDSDHPKNNNPDLAKQYDPLIKKPMNVIYDEMGNTIKDIPEEYENLISKVFMLVFIHFPEEDVGIGNSWSFDTPKSGISWTYTISSISKKKVEVSFVGIMKTDNMSGVIEGSANIHPTMGVVTKSNSKSTISMTDASGNNSSVVINTTISVKE
jgi:hypothetical protein